MSLFQIFFKNVVFLTYSFSDSNKVWVYWRRSILRNRNYIPEKWQKKFFCIPVWTLKFGQVWTSQVFTGGKRNSEVYNCSLVTLFQTWFVSTLRSGIVRKAAQAVGEVGSGREQREEQQFVLLGDEQLPEHYQQQQQQRRRRLPEEDEPTGHQLPGVPAAVPRAATSRHQTSAALLHPPWRPARWEPAEDEWDTGDCRAGLEGLRTGGRDVLSVLYLQR